MVTRALRPLRPEERAELAGWLDTRSPQWRASGCEGVLVWIVGAAIALVLGAYLQEVTGIRHGLLWTFMIVGLACYVTGRLLNRRASRRWEKWLQVSKAKLEQDLADGRVSVLHCTAMDAIRVEVDEDTGDGLFLDVGDGQVLYLEGDYLDDLMWGEIDDNVDSRSELQLNFANGHFPNSEFEIVKTGSGHLIKVECLGQRFPPSREITIEYGKESDPIYLHLPQDGDIFPGSLKTLLDDLRKWKQSKRQQAPG